MFVLFFIFCVYTFSITNAEHKRLSKDSLPPFPNERLGPSGVPGGFNEIRPSCDDPTHPKSKGVSSPNWMAFNRSTTTQRKYWCIGVFSEVVEHDVAEKKCAAMNSTLTAFESNIEVEDFLKRAANVTNNREGFIWVGLKRTPECSGSKSSACTKQNAFNYVDGVTRRSDYWATGQPKYQKKNEDCAVVSIGKLPVSPSSPIGKYHDMECSVSNPNYSCKPRNSYGYACGKWADIQISGDA